MDFDRLVKTLHGMRDGECIDLSAKDQAMMKWNSWLYDDLVHALRGNLVGSGWGVYQFVRIVETGGLRITKGPEEDSMTLDRDGRPLPHEPSANKSWMRS